MTKKIEPSGRRSVELTIELAATPEEVWSVMATGAGISSWFAATEVEEHEGGAIDFDFGGAMRSSGQVTCWDPPRKFAYQERDWSKDAPPLATEIFVEARSGDVCVVRMVHTLFTASDAWDDELESIESGWPIFFEVLRLRLAHFRRQPCASSILLGRADGTARDAWLALVSAVALDEPDLETLEEEARVDTTGTDAPPLSGVVVRHIDDQGDRALLLRLDRPGPGIALLSVATCVDPPMATLHFYFYGPDAEGVRDRAESAWRDWMQKRFPIVHEEPALEPAS